jgi:WD40 repeat protein
MSLLTSTKASWHSPPASIITCVSCNKQGDRVVAGMSNGSLVICSFSQEIRNFTPELYCVGPPDSINYILCYSIHAEDADGEDNVFVSITEKGDTALWNLQDGNCLQTRHERNDGVQGILQGAQMHSNGSLICFGECNNIVVLDGASLEVSRLQFVI